jgi:hypothetical protein
MYKNLSGSRSSIACAKLCEIMLSNVLSSSTRSNDADVDDDDAGIDISVSGLFSVKNEFVSLVFAADISDKLLFLVLNIIQKKKDFGEREKKFKDNRNYVKVVALSFLSLHLLFVSYQSLRQTHVVVFI